ncbi:MAG TPA: hypothetical protein VKI17_06905 [Gemmataceae bacterium]|nr:hypothetical protein [Gemmataceae bacterium]
MSGLCPRLTGSGLICASLLAAALIFLAGARARALAEPDDDLLDQVRRTEQVAAQKLETELRATLRDGAKLAKTDPALALERYRQALAELENDAVLPAGQRESLKRVFKDRIRTTKVELARASDKETRVTPSMIRRAEEARQAALRDEIGKTLRLIQSLQRDGKTAEANRLAEELARNHPESAEALAAARSTRSLDLFASARRLQNEQERGHTGALAEIEKSSTPAGGDVEFPKDWKEKTAARSTAVKLTAKEKAILRALSEKITVNFKNTKLQDVLDTLETKLGVTLVPPDQESLKEIEASYDTPITLNLRGVSARTVLRKVFADLGMTYVIKDESIYIVSQQRAKELMVTRAYYIGDILAAMSTAPVQPLAGGLPLNPGGPQLGAGLQPFAFGALPVQAAPANPPQAAAQGQANNVVQNAAAIMEIVRSSVDPQSWRENGGAGTITYNAATMSLIIRQSAEVHAQLASGGLAK